MCGDRKLLKLGVFKALDHPVKKADMELYLEDVISRRLLCSICLGDEVPLAANLG